MTGVTARPRRAARLSSRPATPSHGVSRADGLARRVCGCTGHCSLHPYSTRTAPGGPLTLLNRRLARLSPTFGRPCTQGTRRPPQRTFISAQLCRAPRTKPALLRSSWFRLLRAGALRAYPLRACSSALAQYGTVHGPLRHIHVMCRHWKHGRWPLHFMRHSSSFAALATSSGSVIPSVARVHAYQFGWCTSS